jgi:hypothetical protein
MVTDMQWTAMQLRFIVVYLAAAMASKKRVMLDLTLVKVIEASDKAKLPVKEFMTKFNTGKTQVYVILKAKSEISLCQNCSNGSIKKKN